MSFTGHFSPARDRRVAAFTLIELALALAVIGFALVAIIGVLPTGLTVQRDNRQETIINQDATIWMDALRTGGYEAWRTNSAGLDDLTNYVTAITNVVTEYLADGTIAAGSPTTYGYTYTNWTINNAIQPLGRELRTGFRIVGLLGTAKYEYNPAVLPPREFRSNYVVAYVRAISGAATEKPPQDNTDVQQLGFNYRFTTDIVPFSNWDTNWIQTNVANLSTNEFLARSNYWMTARTMNLNLYDVRLLFRWPVLPNGNLGSGRQVFRTMISGDQTNSAPYHFFEPRTYVKVL